MEAGDAVAGNLSDVLERLQCGSATVITGDAIRYLENGRGEFDLALLDPPFDSIDLGYLCTLLEENWLAPGGRVYLEINRRSELPGLPANWTVVREKTAGQVRFALAMRNQ